VSVEFADHVGVEEKRAGQLSVDRLVIRFGGVAALDDVSFAVSSGTLHSVIGPNGAGKSTLFNIVSGFYRALSGSVRVDGVEVTRLRPHQIAALGVGRTFQHPALVKELSVIDNLLVGRQISTTSGFIGGGLRLPHARREERENRLFVQELADDLHISHVLARRASEISYGEQKRVELARALAHDPKILLLDEPVAGMNAIEMQEMARVIEQVRSRYGVTIVLVEHDMRMVMTISEIITVLDFGKVIAEGVPDQIRQDPAVRRAYLGTS
jgi:branched-chain amino acid transport system ATP-binding protein